ncbi:phosphatidylglycerophosphatase A [Legionella israelensis]|uniref:Phosphatidylglycerophosphatase A n=1 Tax=Legionella israelensis TaxID=454 RepID=A0AAX1EEK8_9GAMM|nr:phosphatidylglycerophosphatase A [Legionella israelensis]QBR83540.1 phosphatidylglycerophosphatase A [Legionella israelensis]
MNSINLSNRVWQDPVYFIAFGFGSGLMSFAPGTWGTVAAMPLFLLMHDLPVFLYLISVALLFALGVWVSDVVSKDLGVHDYKGIVWDEVVGYLLTMCMAPAGFGWMIIGFLLFRIFDIWKPQPISYIDQYVGGGFGIMLDDLIAAVPAWVVLQILAWNFAG